MFKIILSLICLSLFTSCATNTQSQANDQNLQLEYVLGEKSKQLSMEEDFCLACAGIPPASDTTDIKAAFAKQGRVSLSEAQRLCVKCVEELQLAVNQSECPKVSSTEVMVMFFDEDEMSTNQKCAPIEKSKISRVTYLNNRVCYFREFQSGKTQKYDYEEPYEDALRLVQEQYGN